MQDNILRLAKRPTDQFKSHLQKTHLLYSISYLFILVTENLFCQVAGRIWDYCLLCFSFSLERLGAGLQWCRTLTAQRKTVAACPELKCRTLFPYKYTLNCIRFYIRILFFYLFKEHCKCRQHFTEKSKIAVKVTKKEKPCKSIALCSQKKMYELK